MTTVSFPKVSMKALLSCNLFVVEVLDLDGQATTGVPLKALVPCPAIFDKYKKVYNCGILSLWGVGGMPAKLYRVSLTQEEREHLLGITRRGKSSVRKVKRSLILCKADEGLTDQQVAEALMVGPATVGRVRQRFVEGGLKRALDDLPRPGQRRKLDGKQEAHLVAVACSAPPEGHARWTLRLLAGQAVELGLTGSISRETVRQVLKKTNSSRGGRRSGASPR